ncbi:hypothetical protein BGX38DRAFT_1155302 [Terfezia claveryi]|nr:hypothetical protein BGX38DRAFT_1155302 [Terfezia claveryi]
MAVGPLSGLGTFFIFFSFFSFFLCPFFSLCLYHECGGHWEMAFYDLQLQFFFFRFFFSLFLFLFLFYSA